MKTTEASGIDEAPTSPMNIADAKQLMDTLMGSIRAVVKGRDGDIDLLITALLADGHVLLEDFPGTGKTLMAERLALSIKDDFTEPDYDIKSFKRIQCTPDLTPSDITGYEILHKGETKPRFQHGPIFAYVVLLDEINRAPSKVQSACLEAMAEKQVTVIGKPYDLSDLFFVIGTQNPLDQRGTYQLPAAQLDRFLFKRVLQPLQRQFEAEILSQAMSLGAQNVANPTEVPKGQIIAARQAICEQVDVCAALPAVLLDIAMEVQQRTVGNCEGAMRTWERYPEEERLKPGSRPSTRSLKKLIPALKVYALLKRGINQKAGVEDVRALAHDFLRHRISPVRARDNSGMDLLINNIVAAAIETSQQRTVE